MQIKTHIAVFLALLMLTKLVAFDGQLLNHAAEPGELMVVNHSCKFKDAPTSVIQPESLEETPSGLQIPYSTFCVSYFQFEVIEPIEMFSIAAFKEFTHPVPDLRSAERQITSPPPKTSV